MSLDAEDKFGLNGDNAARHYQQVVRLMPAGLENWPLTEQMRHCADFCLASAYPIARKLRCLILQNQVWCRRRDLAHDTANHAMVYMLLEQGIITKRQNQQGLGWHIRFTPFTRGWAELVISQFQKQQTITCREVSAS